MKSHIQLTRETCAPKIITCGDPKRAQWISTFLTSPKQTSANREYHSFKGSYEGKPVTVISHGVGAAGATICFRELIEVGAQEIIRIGTAGALYDDFEIGDLVIGTAAVRQEGVSKLMVPVEYPAVADHELTHSLISVFQKNKTPFKAGIVLSSDIFYPGLLDTQLELYSKARTVAVEMECSALFTTGSLFGLRTGAVLACDGNPLKWTEGKYDPNSKKMGESLEKAVKHSLEALVQS